MNPDIIQRYSARPVSSFELPPGAVELRDGSALSAVAMAGAPAILFGSVFLGAGTLIVVRALTGSMRGMHAPRELLALCGGIFAIAGAWVIVNGALDLWRKRAAAERAAAMPGQPWYWDHSWRSDGTGNDTMREVVKAFGFALFIVIFLLPFHWVGFMAPNGPRVFGFAALLFDLFAVGLVVRGVRLLLMRRRYGASWLRFARFPFHAGDRVEVSLDGYGGLSAMARLTGTLRCVQERYETRGTGRNRSTKVIRYALWSATSVAARDRNGGFAFCFDVPAGAPSTALSERPARYWELAVSSDDVPGVDYAASFLVPVYAAAR